MEEKMSKKPGFMMYHSMLRAMKPLDDATHRRIIDALLDYSECGELPVGLESAAEALFNVFRDKLDYDTENYEHKVEQSRKAGLASAEARRRKRMEAAEQEDTAFREFQQTLTDADERQRIQPIPATSPIPTQTQNSIPAPMAASASTSTTSSATSTAPVSPKAAHAADIPKKEEEAFPPTKEMILSYLKEKGWETDVDDFLDQCRAAGWKDGNGEPVKNWRIWLKGYVIRQQAALMRARRTPDYRIAAFESLKQKYAEEEQTPMRD